MVKNGIFLTLISVIVAFHAVAARAGHDAVVSPFSHVYFDLGDPRKTALAYGLEHVPDGLSPDQARHILGPHAPAWNQPQSHADEMIFPRLIALAEIRWTDNYPHIGGIFAETVVFSTIQALTYLK